MSDDDNWEDPFDNDDDNDDPNYFPNELICEIAFFEYENSFNNQWINNDVDCFMNNHLKYNLGSHVVTNYKNVPNLFHGTSILVKTFFKFPFQNILSYLKWYTYEAEGSFTDIKPPTQLKLHIFQLFIKPFQNEQEFQFESTVVIKTIWLALIQRHWKRIFKNRKEIFLKMKTNKFLAYREISSHYKHPSFPLLKGMMSCYHLKK